MTEFVTIVVVGECPVHLLRVPFVHQADRKGNNSELVQDHPWALNFGREFVKPYTPTIVVSNSSSVTSAFPVTAFMARFALFIRASKKPTKWLAPGGLNRHLMR
jgi:hypothetical protein